MAKARKEGAASKPKKATKKAPSDINTAMRQAMADEVAVKKALAEKPKAPKPEKPSDVTVLRDIITRFKEKHPIDWSSIQQTNTEAGLSWMLEVLRS